VGAALVGAGADTDVSASNTGALT